MYIYAIIPWFSSVSLSRVRVYEFLFAEESGPAGGVGWLYCCENIQLIACCLHRI